MKLKITGTKKLIVVAILFLNVGTMAQDTKLAELALDLSSKYLIIRDFALSTSGDEAYVTVQSALSELSVLASIKRKKNTWAEPQLVSFSGKYMDMEPFFSKDNLRLYFASNRPLDDSEVEPKDFDIWYVERKNIDSDWGNPTNMGAPINTEHNEFYASIAHNNNLYFTSDNPIAKGKDDILFSAWEDGKYSDPISLSDSINTAGYEFNSFISPDESYLIFSGYSRADGLGSGDLYISYKDKDGSWGKAVNMGKEINSKYMDYCPFVDFNSMTLYFTSKRSSFNEVNDFQSMEEVLRDINKSENGMSKIYKADFQAIINTTSLQ
ncbi:MAG: hypothetical protein GY816_01025 [Cytophagales bacterium]|nr:hypothetical protein [Cytophagales bacterium]